MRNDDIDFDHRRSALNMALSRSDERFRITGNEATVEEVVATAEAFLAFLEPSAAPEDPTAARKTR